MPGRASAYPVDRRTFIRRAGAGLAGAALATLPGVGALAASGQRKVYRLSDRGQVSCNACKAQNANRYYFNKPTADGDRPHLGCNCRILDQWLPKATHEAYFGHGRRQRKIFDQRWG